MYNSFYGTVHFVLWIINVIKNKKKGENMEAQKEILQGLSHVQGSQKTLLNMINMVHDQTKRTNGSVAEAFKQINELKEYQNKCNVKVLEEQIKTLTESDKKYLDVNEFFSFFFKYKGFTKFLVGVILVGSFSSVVYVVIEIFKNIA